MPYASSLTSLKCLIFSFILKGKRLLIIIYYYFIYDVKGYLNEFIAWMVHFLLSAARCGTPIEILNIFFDFHMLRNIWDSYISKQEEKHTSEIVNRCFLVPILHHIEIPLPSQICWLNPPSLYDILPFILKFCRMKPPFIFLIFMQHIWIAHLEIPFAFIISLYL